MKVARGAVCHQRRHESLGFAHAKRGQEWFKGRTNWSQKYNRDQEQQFSRSTKDDEKAYDLFGFDKRPFVHAVKETRLDGRQSVDRALWEKSVYSQNPDLRLDWTHESVEGVVYKLLYNKQMKQTTNDPLQLRDIYNGMYPEEYAKHPGQYWRERSSKLLYTHMLQKQEARREVAKGDMALPADDYQTINGVAPLLSALTFRELKHRVHAGVVAALNAVNKGRDADGVLRDFPEGEARTLAVQHVALTLFWRSLRPNGGTMRDGMLAAVRRSFTSVGGFEVALMTEAQRAEGEEFYCVWVVRRGDDLHVVSGDSSFYPSDTPVAALPFVKGIWEKDYDTRGEVVQRFVKAFDWEHVYNAFRVAGGDEPLFPVIF